MSVGQEINMQEEIENEIVQELNSILDDLRGVEPLVTRQDAVKQNPYLEDVWVELVWENSDRAEEWIQYDDTDLTGDYIPSLSPGLVGLNQIGSVGGDDE